MVTVATLVHNIKSVIRSANREYIEVFIFNENLTIKESFSTRPKQQVTVTSNLLIGPNSN